MEQEMSGTCSQSRKQKDGSLPAEQYRRFSERRRTAGKQLVVCMQARTAADRMSHRCGGDRINDGSFGRMPYTEKEGRTVEEGVRP